MTGKVYVLLVDKVNLQVITLNSLCSQFQSLSCIYHLRSIHSDITEIDLEKTVALFQYYDEDTKCAIVSDQNFEDKSIPMSLIGCSQDHLVAGDELNLHCHEDAIVKITLPTSVLSRIKKK